MKFGEIYDYRNAEEVLSDEEFDAEVEKICKQYEPYWKKAVIVYVQGGEHWTRK